MTSEETIEVPSDAPILPERIISVVPGQVIGDRYRVEAPLGAGGMGVVCRATHLGLDIPVAIKLIRPDFNADAEFVRRFLNEARRAALLRSDRIARVHDVGQLASGEPFLVMELLEGIELGQYLKERGPLPVEDATNVVLQICEGLAEAHASGIVHRDIKPGNTFLVRRADGRFSVKILDFGISKQVSSEEPTTLTGANTSLGSPWYMSPEQMLDASKVDGRSDIWSVGVVLFELLTGTRPFDGGSVAEVCAKVLTTPAPSLSSLRPDAGPGLEAIVERCLAKDVNDRYPDVATLGAALQSLTLTSTRTSVEDGSVETTAFFEASQQPSEGSIAPVVTLNRPSVVRRMRRAHVLGAAGLVVVLALCGLAFGSRAVKTAEHATALIEHPLAAGPAALPLDRGNEPTPLAVEMKATAPASTEGTVPPNVAALPPTSDAPIPTAGAVSEQHAATLAPSLSPRPSEATVPTAAVRTAEAAAPPVSRSSDDPPLSAGEITSRKERYVRWLAQQGLHRIEDDGSSSSDNPYH